MKALSSALLLSILIFSAVITANGQDGDLPTSPPQISNQDLQFDHLTTEDGLSSNQVLSIMQDSHGFMWFGTWNGLNRYDGHTITVFTTDPGDPDSISSNIIRNIIEDQHGILWIATSNGGLNRFDPLTQTFAHYLNDPEDPNSISDNSLNALIEDHEGYLWLGTGQGLDRFDPATGTFTHYPYDPEDPNILGSSPQRIIEDNEGNLWFATFGAGLSKLHPKTGQFTHFRHDPGDPASLITDRLLWVYEDSAGNIWIATDEGLDKLVGDGENAHFIHYRHEPDNQHSIFEGRVVQIFEDSFGTLWVGGRNGGVAIFDPKTEQFTHYVHNPNDTSSLSHNLVKVIYEDKAGILWLGTFGGGINIFNPATKRFARYQHDPEDPNSLGAGGIQATFVDADGVIWLGITDGGLDKLDPTTGKFTHYRHDPDDPDSMRGDHVRAIYEDSFGTFWVGTWSGLDQFDRDTEQFRHIHDARIVTAYEDSSGVMWFGTVNDGLLRFDRESEQFKVFGSDPNDPDRLSSVAVSAVLEDQTGALWVGTWGNGLNRFDWDTERFRVYRHDPDDPNTISNDRIEVLYEDLAGRLWIGTANGVNNFNRGSETFTHLTIQDGLPDNYVNGILEEITTDSLSKKLWFGTKKGLARFDPNTETFQNYNMNDGLQGDASDAGHIKTTSGQMIFGNETGFTTFYPEQIVSNPYIPSVVLTNLKLLNQAVTIGGDSPLQQAIWETEHLTLSYVDDVITFEFTAFSYANPAENLLQYKMEGFDENWSPASIDHSATYTNLDPGEYVFRVRGSNNDGVWNEEGTALNITITPPWWETIWFRGGLILLLVAGLFGAYRWRVSSLEYRSRQLESQVTERTKELTTLLTVSQNVTSTLELEPLLRLILDELKKVVDYDVSTIRRLVRGNMELQAHRWLFPQAGQPSQRLPVAEIPIVQEMVQSQQAILVDDHQFKLEIVGDTELHKSNLTSDVLQASRTLMSVPLIVKGEVIGMLVLGHHQPSYWGEEIKELVQAFANQVAVAIVNAELFEKVEETATLEERTRLARELHDSATQSLYSATLFSEAGKELAEAGDIESARHYLTRVGEVVYQALKDMRLLVFQLRPPILEKEGLVMALQHRLDAVEKRAGMDARLISDPLPHLSDPVSEELYSITIEALNNTLKHAQADKVTITIRPDEGGLELEVRDDGQGFDPETAYDGGGMGLANMAERAAILDADLTIDSSSDQGTSIRVIVPPAEQASKSHPNIESKQ